MLPHRTVTARAARQLRPSRLPHRTPASPLCRHAGRRGYANASETAEKAKEGAKKGAEYLKSSDMPWLIASVAVTIPSTYLILKNGSWGEHTGMPGAQWHGEGDHDEGEEGEHGDDEEDGKNEDDEAEGKEGEEGAAEGDGEEKAEEKAEGGDDEQAQEGGDDEQKEEGTDEAKEQGKDAKGGAGKNEGKGPKGKGDEGKGDEGQGDEGKGDEGKGDEGKEDKAQDSGTEEVQRSEGKNVPGQPKQDKISKKTKDGEDAKFTDTVELGSDDGSKRIHKPDAKGGAKRRIESGAGKNLGSADGGEGDESGNATSGKSPDSGSMHGKQSGLSNTDTKHSIDIGNDPEKSKKADGTPDTAKTQGTVDTSR